MALQLFIVVLCTSLSLPFGHHVFYKIVFDIYMFCFSMELRVFSISYSSLIKTDDHRLYGISLIDQMFQESS